MDFTDACNGYRKSTLRIVESDAKGTRTSTQQPGTAGVVGWGGEWWRSCVLNIGYFVFGCFEHSVLGVFWKVLESFGNHAFEKQCFGRHFVCYGTPADCAVVCRCCLLLRWYSVGTPLVLRWYSVGTPLLLFFLLQGPTPTWIGHCTPGDPSPNTSTTPWPRPMSGTPRTSTTAPPGTTGPARTKHCNGWGPVGGPVGELPPPLANPVTTTSAGGRGTCLGERNA